MSILELSTTTAPTARSHLPDFTPIPTPQLSRGTASSALSSLQARELLLIDDSSNHLTDTLHAVARFADRVVQLDTDLGKALTP